jgi:hypothetical protein
MWMICNDFVKQAGEQQGVFGGERGWFSEVLKSEVLFGSSASLSQKKTDFLDFG